MASAASASDQLVVLCASHISTEERATRLGKMLDSWKVQTHPVSLFLSISFDTKALRAGAEKVLATLPDDHKPTVLFCKERKTQFQHYQHLAKTLLVEGKLSPDTWILFSDDDDTWDKERCHYFHEAMTRATAATAFLHEKNQPNTSEGHRAASALRLDLEDGSEYWQYCVRLGTLTWFLDHLAPELVSHPFADTLLARFLERTPLDKSKHVIEFTPPRILYNGDYQLPKETDDPSYARGRTNPSTAIINRLGEEMDALAHRVQLETANYRAGTVKMKQVDAVKSAYNDTLRKLWRNILLRDIVIFAMRYTAPDAHWNAKVAGYCPPFDVFYADQQRLHRDLQMMRQGIVSLAPELQYDVDKPLWEKMYTEMNENKSLKEWRVWLDAPLLRNWPLSQQ